jgi:hypothetical protein
MDHPARTAMSSGRPNLTSDRYRTKCSAAAGAIVHPSLVHRCEPLSERASLDLRRQRRVGTEGQMQRLIARLGLLRRHVLHGIGHNGGVNTASGCARASAARAEDAGAKGSVWNTSLSGGDSASHL